MSRRYLLKDLCVATYYQYTSSSATRYRYVRHQLTPLYLATLDSTLLNGGFKLGLHRERAVSEVIQTHVFPDLVCLQVVILILSTSAKCGTTSRHPSKVCLQPIALSVPLLFVFPSSINTLRTSYTLRLHVFAVLLNVNNACLFNSDLLVNSQFVMRYYDPRMKL